MLDTELKTKLQGCLERLSQPVEIVASVDDGDESHRMLDLLNDIVALSPLVTLDPRRDEAAAARPSFALRRPPKRPAASTMGGQSRYRASLCPVPRCPQDCPPVS